MKCDELKSFNCVDSDLQEFCEPRLVYPKSEVDKVIAELKEHVKGLILDNYLKDKELRHHKHKRCLAMARWCFTKSNYHYILARHGEDSKKNNRKSILYSRWHKRWIKIAEQFKEAK